MRGFRKTSTSALGSSWLFLGRRRMNPDHWISPNEPPQRGPSSWLLATRFDDCTRVQWFPCFKRAASSSPSLSPTWTLSGGGRKRERKWGRARRCFDDRLLEAVGNYFGSFRHDRRRGWAAPPVAVACPPHVSHVSSRRRPTLLSPQMSCRPLVYPATYSPRRAGFPNGPVHARGQIECLYRLDRGGSGRRRWGEAEKVVLWLVWLGEPNFWRRWPTIHLDGPCVGDDAMHEGQPRNLQCPPVPACAHLRPPVFRAGQPTPRRLPPIRNHIGKNSRGREGVCPIFPPPDRTALGGDSIWEHMASRHTHTRTPRRPCPAGSRTRSQSVPRFVQRGVEHRYRAY